MLMAAFMVVVLFEILFPLGIGLFLKEKFGAKWKVFFLGMAGFIVSQIVHLPMLYGWQMLLSVLGVTQIKEPSLLLIAGLTLAVSFFAGLCEEPARWFAFKLLKEEGGASRHALMYGAGHGGIESMLVGVSVLGNAIVMMMMNAGTFPLAQLAPAQVEALQQMGQLPWYSPLWGGLERFSAVILHISLSVVVWLGVRDNKPVRLLAAMGLHTLFNFVAVFSMQGLQFPVWAIEGLILLAAVLVGWMAYRLIRQQGLMTLYAPEKLDDEEEFSGMFAEQFREAGFAGLTQAGENEGDLDTGDSDSTDSP